MQKKFILYDLSGILSKNQTEKSARKSRTLFACEHRSDEGQELFVGIGVGELGSPTMVEFHKILRAPVIVSMPLLIVNFPIVVSLIINE